MSSPVVFDLPQGRYATGVVLVDPATGQASTFSGLGGAGADREITVITYRCKSPFAGASVGDTITATQIIDVSGAIPTTISTIWRNQTTVADLASAPSAANLELTGSAALTLAQLATAGLALEETQKDICTVVGGPNEAPAGSDSGAASIIQLIKRALQNWTTLLSRIPSLVGDRVPVEPMPILGVAYTLPVAAAGGASASQALTRTGIRGVKITAKGTDVRLAIGTAPQTADATSHYLPMGGSMTVRVSANQVVAALSDTAAAGSIEISELV